MAGLLLLIGAALVALGTIMHQSGVTSATHHRCSVPLHAAPAGRQHSALHAKVLPAVS
jgi:hypothetical protein